MNPHAPSELQDDPIHPFGDFILLRVLNSLQYYNPMSRTIFIKFFIAKLTSIIRQKTFKF